MDTAAWPNGPHYLDPYITLTIALDHAYPNIVAVDFWHFDGNGYPKPWYVDAMSLFAVWLHEGGGAPDAFRAGVMCAARVNTTNQEEEALGHATARCSQTVGGAGARFITLQRIMSHPKDDYFVFTITEVKVSYIKEGEAAHHARAMGVIVLWRGAAAVSSVHRLHLPGDGHARYAYAYMPHKLQMGECRWGPMRSGIRCCHVAACTLTVLAVRRRLRLILQWPFMPH